MKIKDLIEQLQNADPDAEIDLDTMQTPGGEKDLSEDEFKQAIGVKPRPRGSGKKGRRLFFYERADGVVVQCDDRQAWTYQFETDPPWKQVGSSDGKHYWESTKEARLRLQRIQDKMRRYERMKLAPKEEDLYELEDATTYFNDTNNGAIEKELELARGKFRVPFTNQWVGSAQAVAVAKQRLGIGIKV